MADGVRTTNVQYDPETTATSGSSMPASSVASLCANAKPIPKPQPVQKPPANKL
jgi:hypothetical protein